jgi:Ni/Co efflux regulator RcnB
MDMRKLLSYILVLAFALPLVAQESESKDEAKDEKVVRQHDKGDMRAWKQRGDMKRGDGRKMEQRKKRSSIRKKRAIRSVVRILVVGGVAYYIGYHKGQHNKHPMKRKPYMGDRK